MASSIGSRKRTTNRQNSAEDQALNQIHMEAETRLAQRRAARTEARDIRSRELERQRLEEEEKEADNTNIAEMKSNRNEICGIEDKYTKAMMINAHLDNEKQSLRYQVDFLRDHVDCLTEHSTEMSRELKDKTRELEQLRRDFTELEMKHKNCEEQCRQRDILIKENGLVFVNDETFATTSCDDRDNSCLHPCKVLSELPIAALLSPDVFDILNNYSGSLADRIQKLMNDKKSAEKDLRKLQQDVDDERERRRLLDRTSQRSHSNTPTETFTSDTSNGDVLKQLSEYKLKQKRAEQDITTLEGNISRLENQVKRFKTVSEALEKSEEELKIEKRKLQKDLRDALADKEELQIENTVLQKRLDKTKTSSRSSVQK